MVVIIAEEVQGQLRCGEGRWHLPSASDRVDTMHASCFPRVFSVLKVLVAAPSIDLHSILPNTFFNVPTCKQTD
jgi:hypothetical protein